MTEIAAYIFSLLFVLILDLLFVAVRTSFLHVNHAQLIMLNNQEERGAQKTLDLLKNASKTLSGVNFLLVFSRFSLAGIAMAMYFRLGIILPLWAILILSILYLLLIYWLEFFVAKTVTQNPEVWSARLAGFTQVVLIIPTIFLVPLFVNDQRENKGDEKLTVTEDEVMALVDVGEEEGVFEQDERRMIQTIFQLGDTLAREIMIPRIDMLALDVNTPLSEAVNVLIESGHSRVPVYDGKIDNLVGILYAKDLLKLWRTDSELKSLRDLTRPAYFVPEAKKVDELLEEMQSNHTHIAIVVDEYGGIAGLVTLEDIVEEFLGEIQDEYDQEEEMPYQVIGDGVYLFQGRIDLDDFNEIMESNLPTDEADTLGGYIYSRLGHVPDAGEKVFEGDLQLTVEQISSRQIRKVRAQRISPDKPKAEENENDHSETTS